jgi:hypothetical protein
MSIEATPPLLQRSAPFAPLRPDLIFDHQHAADELM